MAQGEGEAESALGYAGYYINDDFSPQYGNNVGYVAVTLPVSEHRRFADYPLNDVIAHLDDVRNLLKDDVPEGFQLSVRPEKDGPPTGKPINIRMLGQNPSSVAELAAKIKQFLLDDEELSPWIIDLKDDQRRDARVYRIKVDAEECAKYGLSVAQVAGLAATVMEGQVVAEMTLEDETIDIRLKSVNKKDPTIFGLLNLHVVDWPGGLFVLVISPPLSLRSSRAHLTDFSNSVQSA